MSAIEVVDRPYSTGGGRKTEVRVQRVEKPGVTETRTWGSYEKITVTRSPLLSTDRAALDQFNESQIDDQPDATACATYTSPSAAAGLVSRLRRMLRNWS